MTSIICDLDGVIYSDDQALPGASQALVRFGDAGLDVFFATNNSTRTPSEAAAKIERLTGVSVDPAQIVTSAQAAASVLVGGRGPALVVGGMGIVTALGEIGIAVTDDPLDASIVVVGMDQNLTYDKIARASKAIRNGARFVASNDDATYPSPGGPLPGAGSVVAAIATASGGRPLVAGKPHKPMRDLLRAKVGAEAWVIGDRVETDIVIASGEPGWRSVLVMSGITEPGEPVESADFVVSDVLEAAELVTSHRRRQ